MVAFRTIPDVSAATSACTVRTISPLDDHRLGVSERSPRRSYPRILAPRSREDGKKYEIEKSDPELEMN